MKPLTTPLILLLLALWQSGGLLAQSVNADSIKHLLVSDWERGKAFTMEYIEAMPEDGMSYKPMPEMRSFAEQMLHLAQGTIGLVSNGTGAIRIYEGENLEKNESYHAKAALTKVLTEAYDFAINAVKKMDASKLWEKVDRGPFSVTRLGWIEKGFEHQTHHRGQTTVYLRLKGVAPPQEKLF